jgi:tetratricopeptide (TPR) repeat protein
MRPERTRKLLDMALAQERAGGVSDALRIYLVVAADAQRDGDSATLSEVFRRMAVAHHFRGDPARACELGEQSLSVARESRHQELTAEALCTLAGFDLEAGRLDAASGRYARALALSDGSAGLRARVLQNLGIIATERGDGSAAEVHYIDAIAAFAQAGDGRGRAMAFHNLGIVHSDREDWTEAARCFAISLELAELAGDPRLTGLCRLNLAEVHLGTGDTVRALASAEAALSIFSELSANLHLADAYRVLGRIRRATGQFALAESCLRTAVEMARVTGAGLSAAAAERELEAMCEA